MWIFVVKSFCFQENILTWIFHSSRYSAIKLLREDPRVPLCNEWLQTVFLSSGRLLGNKIMFNECLERTQNDQTTDVRDTTLKSTATWSLFRAASLSLKLCWKGFIPSTSSKGSWKLPPNCLSLTSHVLSTKPTEIFQKGSQRVTWMNYCNVISKDDVIYGAPLFPDKGRYFFSLFA